MPTRVRIRCPTGSQQLANVDSLNNDVVSFEEFELWWAFLIGGPAVTVVQSERQLDDIIAEESGAGGRLVVVMIGVTSCAPCKRFVPSFDASAREHTAQARFVR